ncbi:MAG: hypothetical protein OXI29_00740 [bacterium]|nr:hypothetical protein [bacterium]MXZ79177.1 hypothetical protein [Acidimicrobiia bacterium]MYE72753.1 hypothetical protein [Acidimicrobiia bacterium]MYJ61878.1 hypothetical protein [Acidimicrobiia bacterium]
MSGEPDPLYVQARSALLDATDALADHLDAIVLVGAQALYLQTGEADLFDTVAPYTTDADFSINPLDLSDSPLLAELLEARGFQTNIEEVGRWTSPNKVYVDLLVPEMLAGAGTRAARLESHGKRVARRARGLEASLVDRDLRTISALDPADSRSVTMNVAGPGALLVAKIHKIAERADKPHRLSEKDSLDVLRLLQATETAELADRLKKLLDDELSASVTAEAIENLTPLFGSADAVGVQMAVQAAGPGADPDFISASMTTLVSDLVIALT